MNKSTILFFLLYAITVFASNEQGTRDTCFCTRPEQHEKISYRIMQGLRDIFKDTVTLNFNLFSVDSACVLTACAPLYVATRMIDPKVHKNFYDREHHKNIHQPNSTLCHVIEKGAFFGIVGLSSLTFFPVDERLRISGRVLALGAISGLWVKNILKKARCDANLRPWNEHFNREKRSHGGFPSGHMFEAAYMTTVYGLQYGLKAGIPLGVFSAAMFGVSVACNRHYVSQTIGGIALGVIYGLAADKLINKKIIEESSIEFCANERGLPSIKLAYYF